MSEANEATMGEDAVATGSATGDAPVGGSEASGTAASSAVVSGTLGDGPDCGEPIAPAVYDPDDSVSGTPLPSEVSPSLAVSQAFRSNQELEAEVLERLKEVVDPELNVNVVDLGLVYGVAVDDDFNVTVDMTLTTPACPLTDQIEWGAEAALSDIAKTVKINWVWLPPWTLEKITEEGREQLRYIGFNV